MTRENGLQTYRQGHSQNCTLTGYVSEPMLQYAASAIALIQKRSYKQRNELGRWTGLDVKEKLCTL